MLSHEENELLTRVGPGTPMGALLRQYWMPAMLSSELPSADCDPVRVMLVGERLIAFRDSKGRVGLVAEACPHRGASLFFARNEDCGLRCVYHGWKFDVSGACVDMPGRPPDDPLKKKLHARAYPCVERGGIVWAYLGPKSPPPPLPTLEANLDESCGRVAATMIENNWLQTVEGDIDMAHLPHLHGDNKRAFEEVTSSKDVVGQASSGSAGNVARPGKTIEIADTTAGFAFAVGVASAAEGLTWSVGHFLFPFFANLPFSKSKLGSYWVVARVPMDDVHTMSFSMWMRDAPQPPRELMLGSEPSYLPNTNDWFGRFRLARNGSNDFLLDRNRARKLGGCGVEGQAVQDAAITWSMGPIVDRTREHLGPADVAILHLRKRLLAAVRGLGDGAAPGVDVPDAYRVKHGELYVPGDGTWYEELRRQGGAGRV